MDRSFFLVIWTLFLCREEGRPSSLPANLFQHAKFQGSGKFWWGLILVSSIVAMKVKNEQEREVNMESREGTGQEDREMVGQRVGVCLMAGA